MNDTKRDAVLNDHIAVKKKLIPPFVHAFGGKLSPYSWTRQLVPEAIWLTLIIDKHGYAAASALCIELIGAVNRLPEVANIPALVRLSSFTCLEQEQRAMLISQLRPTVRQAIVDALDPLTRIAPLHPLEFLAENLPVSELDGERLSRVLENCYDRNGKLSVLAMALGQLLAMEQGKLHVAPHLIDDLMQSLRNISDYPETDSSRKAAGGFRAAAPMLFMPAPTEDSIGENEAPWVGEFWDIIAGFGACLFPDTLQDETQEDTDEFTAFILDYRNAVRADLRARLQCWPLDLNHVEAFEVVSALLCRQATLAIELERFSTVLNRPGIPFGRDF